MRLIAIVLALLMLLTGFAAAQPGPSDGHDDCAPDSRGRPSDGNATDPDDDADDSTDESTDDGDSGDGGDAEDGNGTEDGDAAQECGESPPRGPGAQCERLRGNGTSQAYLDCMDAYCDDPAPAHATGCQRYEEWRERHDGAPGQRPPTQDRPYAAGLQHVSMQADRANHTIYDYAVDDIVLLDEVRYLGAPNMTSTHTRGSTLEVRWDDDRLRIIDNPAGILSVKNGTDGEGAFLLDIVDSATFEPTERGAAVSIGDRRAHLVAPDAQWISNDTLVVTGFASIHLIPRPEPATPPQVLDVRAAIAADRVGAHVDIAAGRADVQAYDDVEVQVNASDNGYSILLSAELTEGRTFVLDIDAAAMGRLDTLRYFDHEADGTVREVVFKEADSLQDILDPTDDDGPEYWTVSDKDGVQVLVSVDRWSVHEVVISFVTQPSVVAGIIAGVLGSGVAAAAMLWPRRREPLDS